MGPWDARWFTEVVPTSQWPNLQYKDHENHSGSTWHRVLSDFWSELTYLEQVLHPFNQKAMISSLVGGFNPSEKYSSNWKSSPSTGENKKYVKPPPSSRGGNINHFQDSKLWVYASLPMTMPLWIIIWKTPTSFAWKKICPVDVADQID